MAATELERLAPLPVAFPAVLAVQRTVSPRAPRPLPHRPGHRCRVCHRPPHCRRSLPGRRAHRRHRHRRGPLSASRPDRAVTLDQGVHQHQDNPRRNVRPAAARAASRAASSSRAAGAAPPAPPGSPDAPRPPGPPVRHSCWVSTSVPPRAPDPSAPPADPADPLPPEPPGPPRAELQDNVEETSVTEPRPGRRAPPCAGWPELAAAPRAPERPTTPVDPLPPPAAASEDPQRP